MLHCDQALELISARLDGELSAGDEARLEEHLQSCAACRALQADFEALHQAMLALEPVEPPAELLDNVLNQIHQAKVAPLPRRRIRWRALGSVAAVLVVALLGAGAVRLGLLRAGSGNSGAAAPAGTAMYNEAGPQAESATADFNGSADSDGALPQAMQMDTDESASHNDGTATRISDESGRSADSSPEKTGETSTSLPLPAAEGTQSTEAYCGRMTLPYSSAPELEATAVSVWYEGDTVFCLLPAGMFEALAEESVQLSGCVLETEGDGLSPEAEWGLVLLTSAPAEDEPRG